MKVVLISMPDVVPILMHEQAVHMPNHGIACVGGNIDAHHDVYLIDLVRKRRSITTYLQKTLTRIRPDLVGLSAMTWQYETCLKLVRLIKKILPEVRIALGGYHATLMTDEIAASPEAADIDFLVRGEGEIPFRRLVNALDGEDTFAAIASLSYRDNGRFIHNEAAPLCDLSSLKLPIRDARRLTSGYHSLFSKIEVFETSRGCTRDCNFCSISHMYGKSYRTYPVERIIEDLDVIYYRNKTRLVFVTDDNLVLNPKWVDTLCEAIIRQNYKGLKIMVQADCLAVAKNPQMVAKMRRAGFSVMFLGIENVSDDNLQSLSKGNVAAVSKQAVDICHQNGIMAMGGLIFGLPGDDEDAIRRNYAFLNSIGADASYCQILTPYPKTRLREQLLQDGLITNPDDYWKYNGLWANVKTQHLTAEELQYFFWYYRQNELGWWNPSDFVKSQGLFWTPLWNKIIKPVMQFFYARKVKRIGWKALHDQEIERLAQMNRFPELEDWNG